MDIAWKYQVPVIVLSDKTICEGMFSMETIPHKPSLGREIFGENTSGPYMRYRSTGSGISPMRFPPMEGEIVRVNSHVHSEDGITTEDPEITRAMADKRLKKMEVLKCEIEDLDPVNVSGNRNSPTGILCWGSNKWACSEAGDTLGLRVIQPKIISPFPARAFAAAMNGVKELYAVETNETAQFARYVSQFGYKTKGNVLKYDGRPFLIDELVRKLGGLIS
jgi:2-oxoglutarate ferredoxin oxidoreductase subunit alpha